MLRLKSNCRTMPVEPRELVEVISVTPAMRPNWRSSGAATEVAMVSGLAPGNVAETWIVGKSTVGRAATGRNRKATAPMPQGSAALALNAPTARGVGRAAAAATAPPAAECVRRWAAALRPSLAMAARGDSIGSVWAGADSARQLQRLQAPAQ